MPHEKFLSRAAKTEIPFLGQSLLRNQSETLIPPAMHDRNSASFFSAGFGRLTLNKPIRNMLFGIVWCNSKQRSNSVVSSPSIYA